MLNPHEVMIYRQQRERDVQRLLARAEAVGAAKDDASVVKKGIVARFPSLGAVRRAFTFSPGRA